MGAALSPAQSGMMTNQTIRAMVRGAVPVEMIAQAIKNAPLISLTIGDATFNELIISGASKHDAQEIINVMRDRANNMGPIATAAAISSSAASVPAVLPQTPAAIAPTAVAPAAIASTAVAPAAIAPTAIAHIAIAHTAVAHTAVAPTAVAPTAISPAVNAPAVVAPVATAPIHRTESVSPTPVVGPAVNSFTGSGISAPVGWEPPRPYPSETSIAAAPPLDPAASPQYGPDMLTDAEVAAAIAKARLNPHRRIGLMLNDQETVWGSALTAAVSNSHCAACARQSAVSGYTIFVYSPQQWIEQMAVNASREMLPFTVASVTADMRVKMLHVVAMPSTPEYLNGSGFAISSSVHRIVITDTTRQDIVQPVQLENGSVTTNSALRSANFSTGVASFLMPDVERLRGQDSKREFYITVTGSTQIKFFKVKEKHFSALFQ